MTLHPNSSILSVIKAFGRIEFRNKGILRHSTIGKRMIVAEKWCGYGYGQRPEDRARFKLNQRGLAEAMRFLGVSKERVQS